MEPKALPSIAAKSERTAINCQDAESCNLWETRLPGDLTTTPRILQHLACFKDVLRPFTVIHVPFPKKETGTLWTGYFIMPYADKLSDLQGRPMVNVVSGATFYIYDKTSSTLPRSPGWLSLTTVGDEIEHALSRAAREMRNRPRGSSIRRLTDWDICFHQKAEKNRKSKTGHLRPGTGTYLFCDTDSLCIVASKKGEMIPCPGGTSTNGHARQRIKALSWKHVSGVVDRFTALNPYDPALVPGSILKIEDVNFDNSGKQRQLPIVNVEALGCHPFLSIRIERRYNSSATRSLPNDTLCTWRLRRV